MVIILHFFVGINSQELAVYMSLKTKTNQKRLPFIMQVVTEIFASILFAYLANDTDFCVLNDGIIY